MAVVQKNMTLGILMSPHYTPKNLSSSGRLINPNLAVLLSHRNSTETAQMETTHLQVARGIAYNFRLHN